MAGSKLMAKNKVPASSILEVVIAMVIILVVFGIAMTIFTNVLRLSLSAKKIKAEALLNERLVKAESTGEPVTEDDVIDGWKIEQQVKPYEIDPALNEIHLTVYDEHNDKIAEVQQVILSPDEPKKN